MTQLKPPAEGYTYNGHKVPETGIEVFEKDVKALLEAGWSKIKVEKKSKEVGE